MGGLISNSKATDILFDFYERAGELLPLPYENETFTILNITECFNCLDHDKVGWLGGDARILVKKYAFHRNRLPESLLFKVPEMRNDVLLVEGFRHPTEEFRYVVQENNLKGLIFTEVWSDED